MEGGEVIYLWKQFIEWATEYPLSAQYCDWAIGAIIVTVIVSMFFERIEK